MAVSSSTQPATSSRYARIPTWLRELDFVTDRLGLIHWERRKKKEAI